MAALAAAPAAIHPFAAPNVVAQELSAQVLKLGVLDKLINETGVIEIPVGEIGVYGRMEIHVRACDNDDSSGSPETTAFLEITDTVHDNIAERQAFVGWMFASSPALSAMDHPRYDVWVLNCSTL